MFDLEMRPALIQETLVNEASTPFPFLSFQSA
jgi:hypothetical protein